MTKFLTAEEAIGLLNIRRQTLYAYVSRGLIRSNEQAGDPHRRLYRADDVNALLGRKRRGRTPARAAQTALDGLREEATVGSRTLLDVLDQEQELLNSRVNLVSAQRDETVAAFQLLAACGQLSPEQLGLAKEKR